MSKVVCILPKAGLANQLFLIASAELFAAKFSLQVRYKNKWQFKIGPYLRKEKNKRNYIGFFKFQRLSFERYIFNLSKSTKLPVIRDPKLDFIVDNDYIIIFESLPHWSSYFDAYIPYRSLVRNLIYHQISDKIQKQIDALPLIDVAIHIRLSDFKKLTVGTDFKNVGATRTPLDYFQIEIEKIKKDFPDYSFYVFTDGFPEEVAQITKIKNVNLFNSINDIVDLYQMSKSKILITSAGSTYSYWAGFLGDCEVIQHPDHRIRIK